MDARACRACGAATGTRPAWAPRYCAECYADLDLLFRAPLITAPGSPEPTPLPSVVQAQHPTRATAAGGGLPITDDGTCAEEYEVPLIDADEDDVEVGYYLWVWLVPALFVLAAVLTLAQKCGWIR